MISNCGGGSREAFGGPCEVFRSIRRLMRGSRRLWDARLGVFCEAIGSPSIGLRCILRRLVAPRPRKVPGTPRRPQELPGGRRKPQDASGGPGWPRELQAVLLQAPRGPQEASGGTRTSQHASGGLQEVPGASRRLHEPTGDRRRPQEAPGGFIRPRKPEDFSR